MQALRKGLVGVAFQRAVTHALRIPVSSGGRQYAWYHPSRSQNIHSDSKEERQMDTIAETTEAQDSAVSSDKASTDPPSEAEAQAERDGQSDSERANSSYLDALLKSPDAYHRDDDIIQSHRGRRRGQVSRSVLDGPMYQRAQSELNQEWDVAGPSNVRGKIPSNVNSVGGYKQRRRKEQEVEPLTPEEVASFDKIFRDILRSDVGVSKSRDTTANKQTSFFDSTTEGGQSQRMRMLMSKTARQQERRREGRGLYRSGLAATSNLALIHERIAASKMADGDIARGIDQAKEQLQMCQTQEELWSWALGNVWPSGELRLTEARSTAEEDVTAGESDEGSEDALQAKGPLSENSAYQEGRKEPIFGMNSPFYAPVLHILLKELRDRFRAPHAALSVLRVTRDLGPESSVLGCTPHLYAEAIRTCWSVLRDLQGARDLVIEAKESGILSGAFSERVFRTMSMKRNNETRSPDQYTDLQNDQLIDSVVESIKYDVQRIVFRADRAINASQPGQELARSLVRMQEMVAEMSKAVRSSSRARWSATSQATNERAGETPASSHRFQPRPSSQSPHRFSPSMKPAFPAYESRNPFRTI